MDTPEKVPTPPRGLCPFLGPYQACGKEHCVALWTGTECGLKAILNELRQVNGKSPIAPVKPPDPEPVVEPVVEKPVEAPKPAPEPDKEHAKEPEFEKPEQHKKKQRKSIKKFNQGRNK